MADQLADAAHRQPSSHRNMTTFRGRPSPKLSLFGDTTLGTTLLALVLGLHSRPCFGGQSTKDGVVVRVGGGGGVVGGDESAEAIGLFGGLPSEIGERERSMSACVTHDSTQLEERPVQ